MPSDVLQGKNHQGLYTASYQYTCMSAYARARIGSTVTTDPCPEPTAYANGSALVYFNSTTYYDDMLWAASWLYIATGAGRRPVCTICVSDPQAVICCSAGPAAAGSLTLL